MYCRSCTTKTPIFQIFIAKIGITFEKCSRKFISDSFYISKEMWCIHYHSINCILHQDSQISITYHANCILHAKQITTFKFSRLWWHFPDVLPRFALSTNARRSLQNKDADWLRILLNKSVTRSSSFAGWIWQVRLRLVFKMASRLYGGQIQSFLVLVGLLLLVTNAQNPNSSPIHRRFEYKYSFKPPYLAQKDGTVPFFEYSGSKLNLPFKI